jgi:hypothetical protein
MINEELEWEKRVFVLSVMDLELEKKFKNKEINKKQKKKIKNNLDDLWIKVWDYYPNKNPSVEKAFKSSFG